MSDLDDDDDEVDGESSRTNSNSVHLLNEIIRENGPDTSSSGAKPSTSGDKRQSAEHFDEKAASVVKRLRVENEKKKGNKNKEDQLVPVYQQMSKLLEQDLKDSQRDNNPNLQYLKSLLPSLDYFKYDGLVLDVVKMRIQALLVEARREFKAPE